MRFGCVFMLFFGLLNAENRVTDTYGSPVDQIVFDFDQQMQSKTLLESNVVRLKIADLKLNAHIEAILDGCEIGGKKVDSLELLFDGAKHHHPHKFQDGQDLRLRIFNRNALVGSIFCRHAALYINHKKVADISIRGNVMQAPLWKDGFGAEIADVVFDFSSKIAGTQANMAVDSAVVLVRLDHAPNYPATVELNRPKGCWIGVDSVRNNRVEIIINGLVLSSNQNIQITSNISQSLQLRFAAAGRYGNKSGAVYCTTPGDLTYTY